MASIREIAKKANVAPGTVSRTLNNKGYVSKETREKVEHALQELEYVPNELARNLLKKKSNTIGVILPDIEHPFFMSIIKYLVKTLGKSDYHVVLWISEYNPETEWFFLDMLKRNVVDGVIIAIPLLPNEVYQSLERPVVMLDKLIDGIPLVATNHKNAGRLAAEKFAQCRRKNVIVTSGIQSLDIPSARRETSFVERCKELDILVELLELPWTRFDIPYANRIAAHIFSAYPNADGILTSDLFAAACYREAMRLGVSVPERFSIISTDGVYSTGYGIVSFSSVVQPAEEIAERSAKILLDLIEGVRPASEVEIVDTYFKQGDTTVK